MLNLSNVSNMAVNFSNSCSVELQTRFCQTLSDKADIALAIIFIGLLLQYVRATFKNNDYLKYSGLPEGLIVLGFLYLAVVRFL